MQASKWIWGAAIAIGVTLLAKVMYTLTQDSDHLNEFVTATAAYRIPSEIVVQGSLFNSPQFDDIDTDGPSVDLFFDSARFGIAAKASESTDENGILITLLDINSSGKATLRHSEQKAAAMNLTGEFREAHVEFDPQLGLYRVHKGVDPEGPVEWELVRERPGKQPPAATRYSEGWVGSCHLDQIEKSRNCVFETEILGMYAYILTAESNYNALDSIKAGVAELLTGWKI